MNTKWTFTVILLSALLGLVLVPRHYEFKKSNSGLQEGFTTILTDSRSGQEKRPRGQFQAKKGHPSVRSVVEQLKNIESGGRANIVILDSNGQYSHGCLQFQRETYLTYANRYGYPTSQTAMMDCYVQTELAVKMLAEDFSNIRHWYNSAKKLNLL